MRLIDHGDIRALLSQSALFGSLEEATLQACLEDASIRKAAHGEVIFVQGDPADDFYVVLDGWIKLYRLTPGGGEAIVAVLTRGQSFAEAAVFTGRAFPVSAEAVSDAELLRIPADAMLTQIRQDSQVALSMLASTSMHLHHLVQQIEQLKAHTGAQRVAEFLASLCESSDGPCTVGLPYDKALIAGRLGMKPESLSRAFARLRDLGVKVDQNSVEIPNVALLQEYARRERTPHETAV